MDSIDPKDLCSLCFKFKIETLQNTEVVKKIEKYLQINIKLSSDSICIHCYNSIEGFHEFYERVHAAQEKHIAPLQQNIPEVQSNECETSIKTNEEQSEICSPSLNEVSSVGLERTSEQETIIAQDSIESNVASANEILKSEASDADITTTEGKNQKNSKHSTLKNMASEIEKNMLEFYNIKCEKCEDATFTSFKMLNKHYTTVHNTQGYVKCCKRNIKVNNKYYLRNHMFKHLQPDTCRCRVCGKELSSVVTLKNHMILHRPTEERPFKCSKCEKRFCCKNDLKNHEKTIHLPETERHNYICDACGKTFQKAANLRYHHSTVHLQERRYICESCAKGFTTESGLRTHISAAHSNRSPIQCHVCHKWLKTKETYQKHLQLHQNNTYPCSHCKKICNSSTSLRSHLIKHSEERPYICTVCKKSFKTKSHLNNHSSQHLGVSHYKCPFCAKLFMNKSNYYTHKKRMHAKERANGNEENATGNAYQHQINPVQGNDFNFDLENGDSSCETQANIPVVAPDVSPDTINGLE